MQIEMHNKSIPDLPVLTGTKNLSFSSFKIFVKSGRLSMTCVVLMTHEIKTIEMKSRNDNVTELTPVVRR